MVFLVLSVNGKSAFVWSTFNDLSGKASLLFKMYTTGYEMAQAVLSSASTLPYSRAPGKHKNPQTQ